MVCRSCTLVCRRRIYLELHIAGLCWVGSYTWLCRIRQLVHRSKSEVCLHQNYFELYIVGVIKVIEESYTWLYLISQKWCLQAAKKNELHIVVLILIFCRVERAIIQPAGREQSALSDPASQPGSQGGGCPALNSLFTNALLPFTQQFPQNVFSLLTNKKFKVSNAPNCETYE